MTIQEAADLVGCSRLFMEDLVLSGEIPLAPQSSPHARVLASVVYDWRRRTRAQNHEALLALGRSLGANEGAPTDARGTYLFPNRAAIIAIVTLVVRARLNLDAALRESGLPAKERQRFINVATEHLLCLDEGACRIYQLGLDETRDWVRAGRPF
jgi:hypothetical protein